MVQFHPKQQGCRISLAHPWNAAGLAKGGRLDLGELFARFFGECCNRLIIDILGKWAVLVAFDSVDLLALPG